jgi:hypothetical protein
MNKYRLYIDESGSHNYSNKDSIKSRYLGLLGVIIGFGNYQENIQPKLISLKKMFSSDPDNLVVLHRDEIVNQQGPFSKLADLSFKENFDQNLGDLLANGEFVLCAVVLDKKSHLTRYKTAAYHPYHYCLNVILERYTFFLEEVDGLGDVMSEARGKVEDNALRNAYQNFFNNGTSFCKINKVQKRLTSKDIKLRTKEKSTEGLELADLLVLASKLYVLYSYGKISSLTDNFCKIIMDKTSCKFRKDKSSGKVKGFGIKLIE